MNSLDVVIVSEQGSRRGPHREAVRRWLQDRGVICHDTEAGLSCTVEGAVVERLFGASMQPGAQLQPPPAIAGHIESITVPPEPEFF